MATTGDGNLYIYCLNVKQADTNVIITPEGNIIIIDFVRPAKSLRTLENLGIEQGSSIEKLIVTHPHYDHYSGVNALLNNYTIRSITLPPFWNKYGLGPPTYRKILNRVETEVDDVDFLSGYSRIYPDGAVTTSDSSLVLDKNAFYLELLGPPNGLIHQLDDATKFDTNHLSIIARINLKKFSMIFAADAQMENWAFFDSEGMLNNSCKILKSAHHGSSNGTQWERLSRLDPSCVIVSSDPGTGHSLPDLIGASVFGKYQVNHDNYVVTITRNTGSIGIKVSASGRAFLRHYRDNPDEPVELDRQQNLNSQSSITDWKGLIDQRSHELYS